MGVLIYGTSYIYGYNMSEIHNTRRPESTLRRKSNSVCCREIRESVVMGEMLTNHILKNYNPSGLMTKILVGKKRRNHVGNILYDIYDDHLKD